MKQYLLYISHMLHSCQLVCSGKVALSLIIAIFEFAEDSEDNVADATTSKWQDPLKKSAAFAQLTKLMEERIIYIDGAMGTSIQKHRYQHREMHAGKCCTV